VITIISVTGIIFTAAYILWTIQRVFLGELGDEHKSLTDLTGREMLMFIPLLLIVIFLGVYPGPAIELMNASLSHLVEFVNVAGR